MLIGFGLCKAGWQKSMSLFVPLLDGRIKFLSPIFAKNSLA
jgi:hypothetical protein